MTEVSLKVTGMSCGHCEKAVSNILEDMGAEAIRVSASDGVAEFEFDSSNISLEDIKREINDAGYEVK